MDPAGLEEILMLAGVGALTAIVILLDAAGLPVTQETLLVIEHEIISLLRNVLPEYVVVFVPTFVPFFFH